MFTFYSKKPVKGEYTYMIIDKKPDSLKKLLKMFTYDSKVAVKGDYMIGE